MVDDNPNDITTSKGQFLWRQRIATDRSHFQPNKKENFSVRSALRVLDVPSRFKPGQIDPSDQTGPVQGLDSVTERYLRADIASKLRVPAEQLLWPETAQHEVGWLARAHGPGLPYEERSTMAGLPPRLGSVAAVQDIALESSLINVMAMKKDDLISKWLGTRQARHPKLEGVLPPLAEPEPSQPSKPKKAKRLLLIEERMQERWQQLQDKWAEEKQKRKDRRRQKLQGAVAAEEPDPAPPEPQQPEPPLGHYRPGASYGLRHAIHSPRQQADWAESSGAVPRPGRHEDHGERVLTRMFYML
eukprot:s1284_g2.t1